MDGGSAEASGRHGSLPGWGSRQRWSRLNTYGEGPGAPSLLIVHHQSPRPAALPALPPDLQISPSLSGKSCPPLTTPRQHTSISFAGPFDVPTVQLVSVTVSTITPPLRWLGTQPHAPALFWSPFCAAFSEESPFQILCPIVLCNALVFIKPYVLDFSF